MWLNPPPVGARVRATNPDDFVRDLANKLRNREGTVTRHQAFSNAPIIVFEAVGRRKQYTWVPPYPRDIQVVETGDGHE